MLKQKNENKGVLVLEALVYPSLMRERGRGEIITSCNVGGRLMMGNFDVKRIPLIQLETVGSIEKSARTYFFIWNNAPLS